MAAGCVFNIQHYSVHDGPGIRTIIFLKGCPLHCAWCSNPESHKSAPEIAYNPGKCIGGECKLCVDVCEPKAITWSQEANRPNIDFNKCNEGLKCADICPSKAISVYGEQMSVDEVLTEVEKDMTFYSRSEGGVTFSGGEPLLQDVFLMECLKECKKRSLHTCIETTGYRPWDIIEPIFELLDYVLIDLKHMDSDKHKAWTGVSNELILGNLKRLYQTFPDKPICVRTPVIPGFNDSLEEIEAIKTFVSTYLPNAEYELLKYHRFGLNKYEFIGKTCPISRDTELQDDVFESLAQLAAK